MKSPLADDIETALLSIANLDDKPDIIFLEVDTSVTPDNTGYVPFLNIYGYSIPANTNFEALLQKALEYDDLGFLTDELVYIHESTFDVNLFSAYPFWPEDLTIGDRKVFEVVNSIVSKHPDVFAHVRKLIFSHAGNLDFVKIIDR